VEAMGREDGRVRGQDHDLGEGLRRKRKKDGYAGSRTRGKFKMFLSSGSREILKKSTGEQRDVFNLHAGFQRRE